MKDLAFFLLSRITLFVHKILLAQCIRCMMFTLKRKSSGHTHFLWPMRNCIVILVCSSISVYLSLYIIHPLHQIFQCPATSKHTLHHLSWGVIFCVLYLLFCVHNSCYIHILPKYLSILNAVSLPFPIISHKLSKERYMSTSPAFIRLLRLFVVQLFLLELTFRNHHSPCITYSL